jgi:H+-transporting ATPase
VVAAAQANVRTLVVTAAPLAALMVAFSLAMLFGGRVLLHLSTQQIQTLAFLILVFGGQGTVYLVRERGHFWKSRPSRWMLWSSTADLALVIVLAILGFLMAALPPPVVASLLAAMATYLICLDYLKIAIFRRSGLA